MLFFHLTIVLSSVALLANAETYVYTFHTLAGNGNNTYTTDALAVNAGVEGPSSVWGDAAGNIFFAEPYHNVIRKITKGAVGSNVITTIAGVPNKHDTPAVPDTGADATAVYLDRPRGIWGDGSGKLLIANTIHRDVLSLDLTSGALTRVTGGPAASPANVDGDANTARWWSPFAGFRNSAGDDIVADLHGCVIRKISGGVTSTLLGTFRDCDNSQVYSNAAAASVKIGKPYAVAGDKNGNIYFPEFNAGRVTKLGASNQVTTLVTGLQNPSGVWVDGEGNIFFSDFGAATVSVLAVGTTSPVILADSSNGLVHPKGIWGDALGNIYIPDSGAHKLFMLFHTASPANTPTTDTSVTSSPVTVTVAGSSGTQDLSQNGTPQLAVQVALGSTYYVWSDTNGNLFITSTNDHAVLRIDGVTNVMTLVAGSVGTSGTYTPGSVPASQNIGDVLFNQPHGIWGDGAGGLYVADTANYVIMYIDTNGGTVTHFAGTGKNGGKPGYTPVLSGAKNSVDLGAPSSVWFDGTHLYIYDLNCIFKTNGANMAVFAGQFGKSGYAFSTTPTSIKFTGYSKGISGQVSGDSNGNVYFSDAKNGVYWRVHAGVSSIVIGNVSALSPNPYPSVDCSQPAYSSGPLCEGLTNPFGVYVSSSGSIYYTSFHKQVSSSSSTPDKVIKVTAPGASSYSVIFNPNNDPFGLAGDGNNNIYAAYGNGIDSFQDVPGSRRLLIATQPEAAITVASSAKRNLRG